MSRYIYTPEKVQRFRNYWPSIRQSICREEYSNRKAYQSELNFQRHRVWAKIDLELGLLKRRSSQVART